MKHAYHHIILCCALLSPFAYGETILDEITVDAPHSTSPREASASSFGSTINTSTANSHQNIGTHLNREPSLRVQQSGSAGQRATISIRGSSAEQVVVLLDGVPLNSGAFGGADLSSVPSSVLESMEVVRGAASLYSGSNSIGGAVHLRSRRPALGTRWRAELGGASFYGAHAHLGLEHAKGPHALVLSHTHQSNQGDYRFVASGTDLAGTSTPSLGNFARSNSRTLSETTLIRYQHQHANREFALTNLVSFHDRELPGLEIETTQLAPANPLEAQQRIIRNTTHLHQRWNKIAETQWTFELGLNNHFEWNRFTDPSPALGQAIARRNITNAVTPYVRSTYTAHFLGTHNIALRHDTRIEHLRDSALNASTTAAAPQSRITNSTGLHDNWQLWGSRVTLTPGLHFSKSSNHKYDLNYRGGISVVPHNTLTLLANIETAHRVPTFTELYHPDQGFIRGNANLASERAWSWDAGTEFEWRGLQASTAYFERRIRDSILFVPISATTIAPVNTGAVLARGIESTLRIEPASWIALAGNYTWLRARFRGNNRQLPGRPQHQVAASIELQHQLSARWHGQFTANYEWLGAVPINTANTVFLGKRATIDLGTQLTWKRHTSEYFARINASNITNIQRYDSKGFPLPRRSFALHLGGSWG